MALNYVPFRSIVIIIWLLSYDAYIYDTTCQPIIDSVSVGITNQIKVQHVRTKIVLILFWSFKLVVPINIMLMQE